MSEQISPKTNTEFFGHAAAADTLWQGYTGDKLAHGWLITGPQGIGKATLAYRFARALLAGEDSMEMSDSNPIFRRILAESHTDFRVIEPIYDAKKGEYARDINVEQAREIAQFLSLTPGESKWRVLIVDSIDQLNNNAANAILKILEEPPPQALLMLISHNPGKLLPTIRSRCRQLRMAPLDDKEFARVLRHVAPQIESGQLPALRELSDCSPGVAMELYGLNALDLYGEMLELLKNLPQIDGRALHAFADQLGSGPVHTQWALFSRLMLALLARVAKQAAGAAPQPIMDGEGAVLACLAALHPPAEWGARWASAGQQFSLASRLHLDYKQVIITFFHSLATKEKTWLAS